MNDYELRVYNHSGQLQHIFSTWINLEYNLKTNEINDLTLTIPYTAQIYDTLKLDYLIELRRNGITEDWFFIRTPQRKLLTTGVYQLIIYARGLNDLLDRRSVLYFAGTARTSKRGPADDVMKDFVRENAGSLATIAWGRLRSGVLPNFNVSPNTSQAAVWEGSHAYKALLPTLRDIGQSVTPNIDFAVTYDRATQQFTFMTYYGQLGRDLSNDVTFAPELGNANEIDYTLSRTEEANAVIILGQGQGDQRNIVLLENLARYDSPWNDRESLQDARNEETVDALYALARTRLQEVSAQSTITFRPLVNSQTDYGTVIRLGDRVTLRFLETRTIKKLTQVHITVSEGKENIDLSFGDYNPHPRTIEGFMAKFIERLKSLESSGEI